MQFPLPFILVLVIPSGAGPGDPRVVIGDPAGSIGIYDSSGRLTGLLTSEGPGPSNEPGFFVFDPLEPGNYVALTTFAGFPRFSFAETEATVEGSLVSDNIGALGTTRRYRIFARTPRGPGVAGAQMALVSESDDGTIGVLYDFGSTIGGTPVTVTRNGRQIPRGVLEGGLQRLTANDVARANGVNTNQTVSPTEGLVAGQMYRVQLHTQANVSTAGQVYALELDYNGAIIGRFQRWSAGDTPVGSLTLHADGSVTFTAAGDDPTPVFTVQATNVGGGTITLTAGATNPRTLSVEHIGEL